MKILCIHGIGHQENGPRNAAGKLLWQLDWEKYIADGIHQWNPGRALQFEFLAYDDIFEKRKMTAWNTLHGVGNLLVSGAVHSIGGLFRRRRAFDDLGEKTKWYAGMVTQWAEDAELRAELGVRLEQAIKKHKPKLICAHSMGTLLSYDYFAEQKKEPGADDYVYLTFGSQIGNPTVRNAFGGYLPEIGARYWFNLFNRHDDLFTVDLRLASAGYEQIETEFERPGVGDHDAEGYLAHRNALHGAWRRIATEDLKPRAVSTRSLAIRDRSDAEVSPKASPEQMTKLTNAPRRRALLIGINDYPDPANRLEGCVNDVFLMSSVLQECGFDAEDIRIVLNDRANAVGIRERLEWLLSDTRPGDECFLYYSGHGAQLPGYGAGETYERLDECLVPWDFDGSRETAITDDQIFDLYANLPYDMLFAAVFDCCHSGGIERQGLARPRGLNLADDIRHRMLKWDPQHEMWIERPLPAVSPPGEDPARWFGKDPGRRGLGLSYSVRGGSDAQLKERCEKYGHKGPYLPVIVQACGKQELSYEYKHGAISHGAFTYSLATILRRLGHAGAKVSFQELTRHVAQQLSDLGYEQTPQIIGPRARLSTAVPWEGARGTRGARRKVKVPADFPGRKRHGKPSGKKAKGATLTDAQIDQIAGILLDELERNLLVFNPRLSSNTRDVFADFEKIDSDTGKKRTRNDDFLEALRHRVTPIKSFVLGKAALIKRGNFPTPLALLDQIV